MNLTILAYHLFYIQTIITIIQNVTLSEDSSSHK